MVDLSYKELNVVQSMPKIGISIPYLKFMQVFVDILDIDSY